MAIMRTLLRWLFHAPEVGSEAWKRLNYPNYQVPPLVREPPREPTVNPSEYGSPDCRWCAMGPELYDTDASVERLRLSPAELRALCRFHLTLWVRLPARIAVRAKHRTSSPQATASADAEE